MENYIHPDAITEIYGVSVRVGNFDDVPQIVAQAIHDNSGSPNTWNALEENKRDKKISRAKKRLNAEAVRKMSPDKLSEIDENNDVRQWLEKIGELLEE